MTLPYNFSLQETTQNIFLHAVDGQFENNCVFEKNCPCTNDMLDDLNVKFLLSLDNDANINDISTELNSEGEESVNNWNFNSFKDSCLDLKIEVESHKIKISNFLDNSILKTEIDKIKTDTVKSFRIYQMQMYNKMLNMIRSSQSMGTNGNFLNMPILDNKNK